MVPWQNHATKVRRRKRRPRRPIACRYSNDTISDLAGTGFAGTISGSSSITLGNGADSIGLVNTITGSLTLNLGSGADTISLTSSITGNLTVNLGNGTDVATIANAPGGLLRWTSGHGNDLLTLAPSNPTQSYTWKVKILFGSGDDTFELASDPAPQTILGYVDGGASSVNGNDFLQDDMTTWTFGPPFALNNF